MSTNKLKMLNVKIMEQMEEGIIYNPDKKQPEDINHLWGNIVAVKKLKRPSRNAPFPTQHLSAAN
jgi:enhancing lycopene biosynthesis protein 2